MLHPPASCIIAAKQYRFWHRHMKVFISWSGEKSHRVAAALHAWLPYIIQAVKPIMSSKDISKGDRWSDVLARELEDTQFGIVCLTPSNIKAPWLNFEAGALSKFVDSSSLSPFLFEVRSEEVEGPLKQFQSTIFAKDDVFSLLTSINNKLEPSIKLDLTLLERTFETWWFHLQEEVQQATQTHESATGYEWLHHPSELSQIQLSTESKSIWVVVSQMRRALQTSCQVEVVEQNIRSGTRYRFIFPRPEPDDNIHTAREFLWNVFERCSGTKEIWEINRDEFEKLVVTDFLILNPEDYIDHPLKVLLEIPVIESKFWIEAEDGAAHGFLDRFDSMCNNSGTLETESEKKS